jgi:hypothetical protein
LRTKQIATDKSWGIEPIRRRGSGRPKGSTDVH